MSTPVGLTAEAIVDEIVGQGTVEGAVVSAVSIGEGVEEYFADSPYEVRYHHIRLPPTIFLDNVARCAAGRREAQVGNNLMETVTESKLLTLNHDKSAYMVVGPKKIGRELEKELEENPLILCGKKMKRVEEYNYLGTIIGGKYLCLSIRLNLKTFWFFLFYL